RRRCSTAVRRRLTAITSSGEVGGDGLGYLRHHATLFWLSAALASAGAGIDQGSLGTPASINEARVSVPAPPLAVRGNSRNAHEGRAAGRSSRPPGHQLRLMSEGASVDKISCLLRIGGIGADGERCRDAKDVDLHRLPRSISNEPICFFRAYRAA